MGSITAPFLTSRPFEDGPYFEGYCGEHEYEYPGVVHLAGTSNDLVRGMYFSLIPFWLV